MWKNKKPCKIFNIIQKHEELYHLIKWFDRQLSDFGKKRKERKTDLFWIVGESYVGQEREENKNVVPLSKDTKTNPLSPLTN